MFVDPLAFSFTKRGELAALKQLLFLAFIESDGAPPNYSIVAASVVYNGKVGTKGQEKRKEYVVCW